MSLKIELKFDESQLKQLEKIPIHVRINAADDCLEAMSKEVLRKAYAYAPRSVSTGTRLKWSKKYSTSAKWRVNSGEHLGSKIKKNNKGALAYIGAKYPKGNKQQFSAPKAEQRGHYLWGKPGQTIVTTSRSGKQYTYVRKTEGQMLKFPASQRFIQRAFDETKPQQLSAFYKALEKSLQELKLG
jgi:hypothetical protein